MKAQAHFVSVKDIRHGREALMTEAEKVNQK